MKILLDGDEVNIRIGDWVSTSTGMSGSIIKIDELSDTVLVGKERAFGNWIDIKDINGLESDGGHSSTFNRMVDEGTITCPNTDKMWDEYKPYHRKDGKVDSDKALKEHSKNGIDKPQMSLIPQHALIEVAKVFMYGARKYDEYNYSKGEKNTVYTDACMRHINQYLLGKDNDDESNLLHLAHAVANLMMIIDNTIIGTNIENRNGAYKV